MPEPEGPPEPWRSFFDELDQLLPEPVALHCLGGFVLIHVYGVARTTNDIDFISLVPSPLRQTLSELAGAVLPCTDDTTSIWTPSPSLLRQMSTRIG